MPQLSGRPRTLLARTAATLVVAASPGALALAGPAAPGTAATCAAGGGVSVVVDFNSLGGGVATGCVAGGGGDTASALFAAAGHELTRAQRQPGFVCRVDAVPADDPCVNTSPADAYWGLWWSNGTSGTWTFSSLGVDSLKVPEGGSVAFSWDDVDGSAPPSATPPKAAASPSASPTTGSGGSAGDDGSGGSGSSSSAGSTGSGGSTGSSAGGATASPTGDAAADAGAGASRERGERGNRGDGRGRDDGQDRDRREDRRGSKVEVTSTPMPSDTASASPEAEVSSDPGTTPASAEADGLPVWVAPLALLVLAGGAGVAVLLRRRSLP